MAFLWSRFPNQNLQDFKRYWKEIQEGDFVPTANEKTDKPGNSLGSTFGKWLYISLRAKKPETVIETGVAHGYSSWVILNALHKNEKGTLYSIDLAGNDTNSLYNLPGEKIGHVVPFELRERWQLLLGDVADLLPELMEKLGKIDVFFHDSDHSYRNMKFEFELAYAHLKDDGLLLSDDIYKNAAFEEFVEANNLKTTYFSKGGMCLISRS